jgi:hypothetical protein
MAAAYEKVARRPLDDVPAAGDSIQLVELGSHCRGAVFLDGARLKTPALEEAIDRIARAHHGFHFGRFDIRTPSVEAFQQGLFSVIELNGVSAEATHIYDPAVSLIEAYRVMFRQWRIAFEIGAANRQRGAQPMRVSELVKLVCNRHSTAGSYPARDLQSRNPAPQSGRWLREAISASGASRPAARSRSRSARRSFHSSGRVRGGKHLVSSQAW